MALQLSPGPFGILTLGKSADQVRNPIALKLPCWKDCISSWVNSPSGPCGPSLPAISGCQMWEENCLGCSRPACLPVESHWVTSANAARSIRSIQLRPAWIPDFWDRIKLLFFRATTFRGGLPCSNQDRVLYVKTPSLIVPRCLPFLFLFLSSWRKLKIAKQKWLASL